MGEGNWRNRWYRPTGQVDLFNSTEHFVRTASLEAMTRDFQNRLRDVFPCVADNALHLKNGNKIMFTLMFACSNPSKSAQDVAKRIANYLLREG
jgi:hypothetical protein